MGPSCGYAGFGISAMKNTWASHRTRRRRGNEARVNESAELQTALVRPKIGYLTIVSTLGTSCLFIHRKREGRGARRKLLAHSCKDKMTTENTMPNSPLPFLLKSSTESAMQPMPSLDRNLPPQHWDYRCGFPHPAGHPPRLFIQIFSNVKSCWPS